MVKLIAFRVSSNNWKEISRRKSMLTDIWTFSKISISFCSAFIFAETENRAGYEVAEIYLCLLSILLFILETFYRAQLTFIKLKLWKWWSDEGVFFRISLPHFGNSKFSRQILTKKGNEYNETFLKRTLTISVFCALYTQGGVRFGEVAAKKSLNMPAL